MVKFSLSEDTFNLDHTLMSGQVFRWRKIDDSWIGIVDEEVLRIRMGSMLEIDGSDNKYSNKVSHYFRLDDDYGNVISSISKDKHVTMAIRKLIGLRLIRQDPWECTISYICATNSNISSISRMIENLSRRYGEELEFEGTTYYTFPVVKRLADADIYDLKGCGLGYRSKFIKETSRRILTEGGIFEELLSLEYYDARSRLMSKIGGQKALPGIGPKVADCILLFSLEKLNAFPIDVWILRVVLEMYQSIIDEQLSKQLRTKIERGFSLNYSDYRIISQSMRDYFGRYSGYAQEFLYYYSRLRSISESDSST